MFLKAARCALAAVAVLAVLGAGALLARRFALAVLLGAASARVGAAIASAGARLAGARTVATSSVLTSASHVVRLEKFEGFK